MVIGDVRRGHLAARQPAHRVGVVLVLDAEALVQGGVVEVGDVPRRVDVGMARAQRSSTPMPFSTSSPAAWASSTLGWMPIPATTASAAISRSPAP